MTSNDIYNLQFCVYLTVYTGSKLPMFYIGSSSVHNVANGYFGSIASKQYKSIFKYELKYNRRLFKIHIVSLHITREDAIIKENKLQKLLNVVKSSMYFNMSIASVGGYCGMDVSGKNNPNYGKQHTIETRKIISEAKLGKPGHIPTDETRAKLRAQKLGNLNPNYGIPLIAATEAARIVNTGKPKSDETKAKLRGPRGKAEQSVCPHCNKTGSTSNMKRWHFDNCKLKS